MEDNNLFEENQTISEEAISDSSEMIDENMEVNEASEQADAEQESAVITKEMLAEAVKIAKKKGMRKGSIITAITLVVVFVVAFVGTLAFRIAFGRVPVSALSTFSSGVINKDVYKKAEGINAMIENTFIYDIDKEAMRDGLYKGMVDSLGDPYSTYYSVEEFKEMMESSNESFEGIGCYLSQDPDTMEITVTRPMKGSPSEAVGLKPGDVFVTVDGEDIKNQDINLVVSKIRGPKGTSVVIGVKRPGESDIIEFTIVRDVVYEISVDGDMLSNLVEDYDEDSESGIGYLYITDFAEDTANQFRNVLNELKDKGATSLILDLRDNGGGYVDVCVDIADMILPECNVVSTKDKHGIKSSYDSSDEEFIRMPMVVLVNENSASAAEILTGALKDNDYATIVGTKTFGKGIVQSVMELEDGSGIKITGWEYYTPSGECIHGKGIEPDVEVELDYDKYLESGYDTQVQKAREILTKGN